LVTGTIELYVEKSDNTQILLDTLLPGSHFGAYSVFNQSPYRFTAKAKGSVSLLILDQVELFQFAEGHLEIGRALDSGINFIVENNVPLCDFRVSDFVHPTSQKEGSKAVFRKILNAIRRNSIMSETDLLNKMNGGQKVDRKKSLMSRPLMSKKTKRFVAIEAENNENLNSDRSGYSPNAA